MADPDELIRIQQAHHRRLLGVQESTSDLVGQAWDAYAGLDDIAASAFEAAATVIVDTGRQQTATLASAYMNANDRAGGFPGAKLLGAVPEIRNGTPTPDVYHRSIVEARRLTSTGTSWNDAMDAGRSRAVATAQTDVILTNRSAVAAGAHTRPWVVGYRRVLTGKSCAFCATASTQRYKRAELLPLHPRCDCDVAEIFGTEDPGRVINRGLLEQLQEAGKVDGRPDYWNGPYVVDEQGAVRYRRLETVERDGAQVLGPNGKPLRRVVAGDRVVPEVVHHGELGATLTDARHATTSADELAAPRRRTRATVSDPDVLAEAQRRQVSAERVVQIREEQAERRTLEQRAIREAARNLAADDPDVVRAARRFGVDPDEVLSARARVADVRKIAREEAARVQAEAMRELDRLDTIRLRNPPRLGARTDLGSSARRGEYDWLGQLSERERARLSRQWYGGTLGPDQFAQQMSAALGRDLSVDDAMEQWLELNRRAEAAGALRRGKLPSSAAYSDQLDPTKILAELADDGYDVEILFGDDLNAAGHVANVERGLVQDEAINYLGEAIGAVEGPSPYRMSFQTWEREVRDLEESFKFGDATARDRRRYSELVPQYLDETGLELEDLYARIVTTARKAGEEVPANAVIPWQ